MNALIKPKEVTVKCSDGIEHTFVISKFPAVDGREILAKYPSSNIPNIGEYNVSKEAMLMLMGYVAIIREDGQHVRLSTAAMVDNHVPDGEALLKLEMAALEYNISFFQHARKQGLLNSLLTPLMAQLPKVIQTLMPLLERSLQQDSPRSKT